jgi:hypothetical protein
MHWTGAFVVVGALAVLTASPAQAICSYKGQLYAKTTSAQELADSQWVVKARVIAADDHWSDKGDPWTSYHLQVLTAFKGVLPSRVDLFTYRNSGGFYLDKGMEHDIGREYLLYLNPANADRGVPVAARGATEVNYACGQSKPWEGVSRADQQHLIALSHGR